MNRNVWTVLFVILGSICLYSCSSVRHLPPGQSMLVKNEVKVVDAKSPDFDNLRTYVRPVTNKKFMDLFRIKTVFYDWGQPTYDKNGNTKDGKFKKFLREKVGEPPVLLDSMEIKNSVDQLKIVMKQIGYFDADVDYKVTYRRKDHKKSKVDYFITAHDPYTISKINYDISIPEYKRIVVLNMRKSVLYDGMQYNENRINDELTRIINLIRNEGYYYVEKSIMRCNVEYDPPDSSGVNPRSVNITILLNIPQGDNASRYLYKYHINDIYVNPDMPSLSASDAVYDTTFYPYQTRRDSSRLYFIEERSIGEVQKPYFSYKKLSDAIFTRTGQNYSQMYRDLSSRALNSLDNFDYINILFKENEALLDTVNKTGALDVYYRMIRKKRHTFGGQVELRNDKSAISLQYTNRNIFRGAEHLTLNLSGGYFYYSLSNLFKNNTTYSYPEFGVSASLDFPNRLFLFNNLISENTVSRSTSLKLGVNYSGLYHKLMYNAALIYRWSPSAYMSHSVSPIDISTINNTDKRLSFLMNYDSYPESYQKRFGKFMLFSAKYSFNYLIPKFLESRRHNMHLSISAESCGTLVFGLNKLFSPNDRWELGQNSLDSVGYSYSSFEKIDLLWNYTFTINKENSIAMRSDIGFIIPLDKESYIPYEKGFYMGTSNSMRGWSYRGLGPGSYQRGADSLYTGDIKLEFNFEYRGTIYRSLKYGIFADVGNIWLARKNKDMPGAEFAFNRFYKELAVDVGAGLRLDFNFFVIRVDYAVPVYDPTRSDEEGRVINWYWIWISDHPYRVLQGLKIAIGYAF
ncbi:MAG: BamA/TamA family outer membrane protein [Bacteroidales bacterium]|nr:BamA/TamA family outer membrane protein [Bacteroidales bacterium]